MRTELELMEKIEKYLSNELSAADKRTFEEQLAADPALQEQIKLQQETMKGIERASLRKQVEDAGSRFRWKNLRNWGLGGLVVIAVVVAILVYKLSNDHRVEPVDLNTSGYGKGADSLQLPPLNEAGDSVWTTADSFLPPQVFLLNASKDTIIETRDGIVLSVPGNGFLSASGEVVKGSIQLIVKEAMDAASIMKAGLSTMSGDRTLETGGMFFIDARQGKQILKINPDNAIYAAVPADTIKPGMMLFKGERTAKGNIDWKNPTPIIHSLVTVDIQSLNFYPPGYLDSLKAWGYNVTDKKFTDSLYYSFAGMFQQRAVVAMADTSFSDDVTGEVQTKGDSVIRDTSYRPLYDFNYADCAINPASVKAFWNEKFQNTFIATREFEERMKYIHELGQKEVIDEYMNNLDKDLSYVDSLIVADHSRGSTIRLIRKFEEFASRRDGKVMGGTSNAVKLAAYFKKKTKAYTDAISKAQRAFWDKQASLDRDFYQKQASFKEDSIKRMNEKFRQEFDLNLKEAYRQLDIKKYTVPVTTTGWYNVDRYVFQSVENQTTLDYTDPVTGKKAVIRYEPVAFSIDDTVSFDRLYVYLFSDKLSTYVRLDETNGVFSGKLNELMNYNMAVVAYKNDKPYFCFMKNVQSKTYTGIRLSSTTETELKKQLNTIASKSQLQELRKEQEFFRFEVKDLERQRENKNRIWLLERVRIVVFPKCYPDSK
jgi:hypothetical protein